MFRLFKMASLNEESLEKKFHAVNNTQDSIQGLSLWVIHRKAHYKKIVHLWYKAVKKCEYACQSGFPHDLNVKWWIVARI